MMIQGQSSTKTAIGGYNFISVHKSGNVSFTDTDTLTQLPLWKTVFSNVVNTSEGKRVNIKINPRSTKNIVMQLNIGRNIIDGLKVN